MELKNESIWRLVLGAQEWEGPIREIMRIAGLCGFGLGPETPWDITREVRP